MGRYALEIAFDGAGYHGWQVQDNAITVQQVLDERLQKLLSDPDIHTTGCGRTDTGVHASQFFVHFDTDQMPGNDFVFRLNRFLPEDIVCHKISAVDVDWHARFDAVRRTYTYYILRKKDPFFRSFGWLIQAELDVEKMNRAAQRLLGEQDFTSFSRLHTQTKTNICQVFDASWELKQDRMIFTITANRFLRNMVRAVVGTLVEVGRGNLTVEELTTIIQAKDRSKAGQSAPANGLFLSVVTYPEK